VNAETVPSSKAPDQCIWTICRVGVLFAVMLHIALHILAAITDFLAVHVDGSLHAQQ
jgi:hypothetical protein